MAKQSWYDVYYENDRRIRENPQKFIKDFRIVNPFLKMYVYYDYFISKLLEKPVRKIVEKIFNIIEKHNNKSKTTESDKNYNSPPATTQQLNKLPKDISANKNKFETKSHVRRAIRKPYKFKSKEVKARKRVK